MKRFSLFFILLFFSVSSVSADLKNGLPFAVVELFTSEGCSSCPAADRLLNGIVQEARANNKRVFAMAFHVDYWDYLGWKDKFGSKAHSDRQRLYTRKLATSTYTPQMIVNGRDAFAGSDRHRAGSLIRRELDKKESSAIYLTKEKPKGGKVAIEFEFRDPQPKMLLNVAVVQRGILRNITRGENTGKVLVFDNVVRSFSRYPLDNRLRGRIVQPLPKDLIQDGSIIVYLQDPKTMAITGAQKVDI